jgi:hypothetical protein
MNQVITFQLQSSADLHNKAISFKTNLGSIYGPPFSVYNITFKNAPTSTPGESFIGINNLEWAINLQAALNLLLSSSNYTVTRNGEVVSVECLVVNGFLSVNFNNTNLVLMSIFAFSDEEFLLTEQYYVENSINKCSTIQLHVYANLDITGYVANSVTYQNPDTTDFVFMVLPRGYSGEISIMGNGQTITFLTNAPSILNPANFQVNSVPTPTGGYLTISPIGLSGLELMYKLESGGSFTSESTFQDVAPGTSSIVVQDNFGCEINVPYTIEEYIPGNGNLEKYSFISPSMPIRFKTLVNFDFVDNLRNQTNTLGEQEDTIINYGYTHYFVPKDVVKIQFLSNYLTNEIKLIPECETDGDVIPHVLVKQFMNIQEKMTCNIYQTPGGPAGLYFTYGDILNYVTNDVESQYNLGGKLPAFGTIGQLVELDGYGLKMIIDIIYDEEINCEVLVLDLGGITELLPGIVSAVYNKNNFNAYEFELDMATYLDQSFSIKAEFSTAEGLDKTYQSENIKCASALPGFVEFIWDYENDTDIIENEDILGIGHYEFEAIEYDTEGTLETNEAFTGSEVVETSNYSITVVKLEPVPTMIAKQIVKAMAYSNNVKINNIVTTINETPKVTPIPASNLYSLELKLISK